MLEPMQPSCLALPSFSDPALQVASLLWGTPRARQIRAQTPTAVQAGPWLCKQPWAGRRAAAFPNPPLALASQSWALLLASSAHTEEPQGASDRELRSHGTQPLDVPSHSARTGRNIRKLDDYCHCSSVQPTQSVPDGAVQARCLTCMGALLGPSGLMWCKV